MAEFMQLTKIPIVIFYGDNIPDKPSDVSRSGRLARPA